ncbi:PHP domain-containing protein [Solicola gregarius]|uniref:PHP domain-containing protein n=1 Tax=Solicola gregarius TaxID=2908642 RepID=A0AA46YM06_9ACTN|nr:PHP domain-containing protein [Solicola gregarius]UYM06149.1 PHP domain-containing protein [Solicola gregarius]
MSGIDLHTHSSRSDGTDSPAELVGKANAAGLDVVALTDHDSTAGWAEAAAAADDVDVTLVRGLEISCEYEGSSVHLLAYEPDPTHVRLLDELARVLDGRNRRLPRTIECLNAAGFEITVADVEAVAGNAVATGRPHVADAMVARGYVANRDEAFDRFLKAGRPAYVRRYVADLVTMIGLVVDAGGVTVIAHPWGRGAGRALDRDAIAGLRDVGLRGIEVDHNDHPAAVRERLRGIARDLDLIVTGSSDYHGNGKIGFDLGCNTTAPREYERLRALITTS